jgi:hypothetical protein
MDVGVDMACVSGQTRPAAARVHVRCSWPSRRHIAEDRGVHRVDIRCWAVRSTDAKSTWKSTMTVRRPSSSRTRGSGSPTVGSCSTKTWTAVISWSPSPARGHRGSMHRSIANPRRASSHRHAPDHRPPAAGLAMQLRRPVSCRDRRHRLLRPLHPLPKPITSAAMITHLHIRPQDRLGGLLHEYEHAV